MFQRKSHGAVETVVCNAPLTGDQLDDLRAEIDNCIDKCRRMLVLDLDGAALIDSSGLELLLDLQDQFERLGGEVKLACCTPVVTEVLHATNVAQRFELFKSAKAATGSFAK